MPANNLFSALSSKKAIKTTFQKLPEPRLVNFKVEEIGNGRPGDSIELEVYGIIKSIHDDGTVVVNVVKAEKCEPEDSEDDKPKMVMTQESHVPS